MTHGDLTGQHPTFCWVVLKDLTEAELTALEDEITAVNMHLLQVVLFRVMSKK